MRKHFARIALLLALLVACSSCAAGLADGAFDADALRGWDANEGYQYVLFGHYPQEYDDEPILWRVLTVKKGRALLLSELILDTHEFDLEQNEWESSDLRTWLNRVFINEAFTKAERGILYDNGKVGKVFIPSDAELTNPDYGFVDDKYAADPNRIAEGTTHAYDNNLWDAKDSDYTNYYTRTKANETNVHLVRTDGILALARVERDNVGVRAAIWVTVEELPFTQGEGTLENPFCEEE